MSSKESYHYQSISISLARMCFLMKNRRGFGVDLSLRLERSDDDDFRKAVWSNLFNERSTLNVS